MAARSVTECEVSFEVDGPNIIRCLTRRKRTGSRRGTYSTPARPNESVALEQLPYRARCWPALLRVLRCEQYPQFLWTPRGMFFAGFNDCIDNLLGCSMWHDERYRWSVLKTVDT